MAQPHPEGRDPRAGELQLLAEVTWRGLPVHGGRTHALLAALVESAGRTVGERALVDEVWGTDRPPANPAKALQVVVSRTRAQTAPEVVERAAGGYRLGLDPTAVDALAQRLVEGIGFTDGVFNVEMRIDPVSGKPRVIEINPRAAGQFFDLFERVDGYSLFEAMLDVHAGRDPVVRHREGRQKVAASFVLRDLTGEGLSHWPGRGEIARLTDAHPDAHIMVYRKRGADLAREMKWLGSYRYGVFNLGAESLEALFAAYRRICEQITFHPRAHSPERAMLLEESAARR